VTIKFSLNVVSPCSRLGHCNASDAGGKPQETKLSHENNP